MILFFCFLPDGPFVLGATVNDNFFGKSLLLVLEIIIKQPLTTTRAQIKFYFLRNGQRSGKSYHGKQRTPCYQVRKQLFHKTFTNHRCPDRNALNIVKDDLIVKLDELTR